MNASSNTKKSLEELEKIYSKKKQFRREQDSNFDRLNIAADELNSFNFASKPNNSEHSDEIESDSSSDHSTEEESKDTSIIVVHGANGSTTKTKPIISENFARSAVDIKKLKKYWANVAFIVLFSSAIYQCAEIFILNAIAKGVPAQNNSLTKFFANELSDMFLFMNVHLNMLMSIVGFIIIVYSAVVLRINNSEQLVAGLRVTPKKLAKKGFTYFFYAYLSGVLIHSLTYWMQKNPKTLRTIAVRYGYLALRGCMYYFCMICFKNAIGLKNIEPVKFKSKEMKGLTAEPEQVNFDEEWNEFYTNEQNIGSNSNQEKKEKVSFDFDFTDWKPVDTDSGLKEPEAETNDDNKAI